MNVREQPVLATRPQTQPEGWRWTEHLGVVEFEAQPGERCGASRGGTGLIHMGSEPILGGLRKILVGN